MPKCGSQCLICDLPIRFDTYIGCSHACEYCFVKLKYDITKIKCGESVKSLTAFINGERNLLTLWCDFDIPLHWGGESDPFQPIEKKYQRSLESLKVFADTQYPFVVSTKNKMISEGTYLDLIRQCNSVVQFSVACRDYDVWERGASSFEERLSAIRKISPYRRVIVRIQPYIPFYNKSIMESLKEFADAGVYGCVVESIKYKIRKAGTVKLNGDFVYPVNILNPLFYRLKERCHELGMKFYAGENRLRHMGDDLCCCGIDGLGWQPNTANLNHYLYDKQSVNITPAMQKKGTVEFYKAIRQDSGNKGLKNMTYEQLFGLACKDKMILDIYKH